MKCSFFKVVFLCLIFSAVSHLYSDSVHEVQKGETLYSISRTYGISVNAIQEANGMSDNAIKVGQKIKIPDAASSQGQSAQGSSVTKSATSSSSSDSANAKPSSQSSASAQTANSASQTNTASSDGTYIVQKGETWFGISKKYGISVADLQKLNGVGSDAPLKVGQKLTVPSAKSAASSSSAVASSKTTASSSSKNTGTSVTNTNQKVPELENPRNYSSKKADSSLVWPVKTENIVYINGKVGGVSMAAKKDEEVKAIRAGTVMFSGSYRGFGNVVFIQSKTGHIYAYTGLGSIDVSKGDYINYSSEIGTAGIDTYTGKSQISLMVFQNGQPIDPAKAPRG